ncbi:MAG: hypothetical protein ACR2J4_02340, partial [Deinococcus sp.]
TVPLAGGTMEPGQSVDSLPLVAKYNELIGIRMTEAIEPLGECAIRSPYPALVSTKTVRTIDTDSD